MLILAAEQHTGDWHSARLGRVTASKVSDATARTRSGWRGSRANYMADLIAERLTGTVRDSFTNAAMQWGTDMEPEARDVYAFTNSVSVSQVGFVRHPTIEMAGASPDGLVDDDGLVEVKCPNTANHIDTLLGASIKGEYIKQMQWQMACCNRAWCDFVSYDPRMPPTMQMHVSRVQRDNKMIADLERDIREFLIEVDDKVARLTQRFGEPGALKAKLEASLETA
ncbi:lambda exonuclease family protein [Bauldia litoralis]|uniref:lambda exonuclease family protein n=1 Tax=Bauldia litoralis TaxID=665467 RepID=UPI0032669D7D